ncbi:MAG TPA: type II toxin-antitoxin system VapC family toxin [Stellaceae bacterium]
MSDAVVVDASVVLALLHDEPMGNFDGGRIAGSAISAVNFAEVMTKLISDGMPNDAASNAAMQLDLKIFPFDERSAQLAAQLWPVTRPAGLSLGDRACIALGLSLDALIITADRAWGKVDFGGRLIVIR